MVFHVNGGSGYTIHTHNGKEKLKTDVLDFCQQAVEYSTGEIVINCIDRDGEMKGYDLELAKSVRQRVLCLLTFFGGLAVWTTCKR